ncbi:MAG: S8 family serine peptidase [Acidimicrobiales bacterium]
MLRRRLLVPGAAAVLLGMVPVGSATGSTQKVAGAAVSASAAPTDLWSLDRINQPALPLDGNSSAGALTGEGVDIYVVDSGVRPSHEQLNGRVVAGYDAPTDSGNSEVDPRSSDCDGHGTHVATVAAGATVGVARAARIVSVRVLDCEGNGEIDDVIGAMRWVRGHHQSGRAAVANLSLGVDLGDDGAGIVEMVKELVRDGIVVVVAAGNGDSSGRGIDACRIAPGNDPASFTVGSVTRSDAAAAYSNFGPCVDIWAPGGDRTSPVTGGWYRNDTDYMGDIGTSMAAPHVAGVVALLAGQQPGLCPGQLTDAVVERSTKNVITGLDATSANRMLLADTAPVATVRTPGRPTNIVVTPDSSSLLVGWDPPCDGGSQVTSYRVSVLYGGKVVKRVTVDGTRRAARVRGLEPGRVYAVAVKASNAVGAGTSTDRVVAPRVVSLRKGRAIRVDFLVSTDTDDEPTLRTLTPKVCSSRPTRLTGLSTGTCRYAVRPYGAQSDFVRTIRVSP